MLCKRWGRMRVGLLWQSAARKTRLQWRPCCGRQASPHLTFTPPRLRVCTDECR